MISCKNKGPKKGVISLKIQGLIFSILNSGVKDKHMKTSDFDCSFLTMYSLIYLLSVFMVEKHDFPQAVKFEYLKINKLLL